MRGVKLGIGQIGHGKRSGLARMKVGDGFVYYSPKVSLTENTPQKAFTAIGVVADDDIWQADEGDFKPWRRRITYMECSETPIRPMLDKLSFTAGKPSWGYAFRYGLLEITEADFNVIAKAMKADV